MVKLHYQVIWDEEAKASLRKIYNHIKKHESIGQGIKVKDAIKELAGKLGFMPRKFAMDPFMEGEPGDYRFKAIWNYKIVYEGH